jgi:predicted permease
VTADLFRECRYALRALARQPAFAITAVVTLGLAIGATTAIFSVVSGVILRPLPFAEPDRLVQIYGTSPLSPRADAVNNLGDIRERATSFAAASAFEVSARYLQDAGGADRVMVVRVEPEFFRMLGVPAVLGRTFGPDDAGSQVCVVSESFWQRRLNRTGGVLGQSLTLDNQSVTIVGVMPASFQFPYKAASLLAGTSRQGLTDAWILFDPPLRPASRVGSAAARLKDGVSLAAANSELRSIAAALELERPAAARGRGAYVEPLADAVSPSPVRRTLYLLFSGVVLVLFVACANVTNLALVRLTRKSREIAVRTALGAGAARVLRPFLLESLAIAVAGGVLGAILASWSIGHVLPLAESWIPRAREVSLDWRTLLFLGAVCSLAAGSAGLLPVLLTGANLQTLLRSSDAHATMSIAHRRLRDGLVVAQVALAFVLATGSALLIRELVRLQRTDSGMATHGVITFHLGKRMTTPNEAVMFYELRDRVRGVPHVQSAGLTQLIPLQNWGWSSNSTDFRIEGRPLSPAPPFPIELRYVTPGYFDTLGIRIASGRDFTNADTRDAPAVVVINEALARKQFPSADPVGLRTNRGTIVGVAADVKQVHLDEPTAPEIYFPIAQNWSQVSELGTSLLVRADGRPEPVIQDVRRVVREASPALAVFDIRTMDQVVSDSLSDFRLYLWLVATLAGVALLLVAIGVHGVVSFVARARQRECAIRVALGATGANVVRTLVGPTVLLAVAGLACGLIATLIAAPILRGLPISVRPPDIGTLGGACLVIAGVTLVSCIRPARRVTRVDPATILRDE